MEFLAVFNFLELALTSDPQDPLVRSNLHILPFQFRELSCTRYSLSSSAKSTSGAHSAIVMLSPSRTRELRPNSPLIFLRFPIEILWSR